MRLAVDALVFGLYAVGFNVICTCSRGDDNFVTFIGTRPKS